jgi:hypothetical protein
VSVYREIIVDTWSDFRDLVEPLQHWVFRGQRDHAWPLQTTLERSFRHHNLHGMRGDAESQAMRSFRQRAHHYVTLPPADDNELEWAALLRHYGGPSRLLDVTRSPYVAAYFALEESGEDGSMAVWAFQQLELLIRARAKLFERKQIEVDVSRATDPIARFAFDERVASGMIMVTPGEPERVNDRMAAQQGLFLVPFDVTQSFQENLFGTFGIVDPAVVDASRIRYQRGMQLWGGAGVAVIKFVLSAAFRNTAWRDLQAMNISAATLYPGLDGFARSLRIRMNFDT